eukprot:632221-Prymnesium_polylepis.1
MADLGLSETEVKRVMAEADVNGDGEITYAEFVPLAVDLVQAMYAKAEAAQELAAEEAEAAEAAQEFMLHGMSREELEAVMKEVFSKVISPAEATLPSSAAACVGESSGRAIQCGSLCGRRQWAGHPVRQPVWANA